MSLILPFEFESFGILENSYLVSKERNMNPGTGVLYCVNSADNNSEDKSMALIHLYGYIKRVKNDDRMQSFELIKLMFNALLC